MKTRGIGKLEVRLERVMRTLIGKYNYLQGTPVYVGEGVWRIDEIVPKLRPQSKTGPEKQVLELYKSSLRLIRAFHNAAEGTKLGSVRKGLLDNIRALEALTEGKRVILVRGGKHLIS